MSSVLTATEPRRFTLSASRTDGVALVALRGELDLPAALHAAPALRALLETGTRELLVDLVDLRFMDAAGLRALITTARYAEALGARVYAFRAQGQPRELVALARRRFGLPGF